MSAQDYLGDPDAAGPDQQGPGWLPPGYTLNPDGSVSDPSGRVMSPAPQPGYHRDPNSGTVIYDGYDPQTGNIAPTPTYTPNMGGAAPAAGPAPGPTPGPTSGPNLTSPFTGQWQQPNVQPLPNAPQFQGPNYEKPPAFAAPGYEDVLKDPGFQLRAKQGSDSFMASRAAMGAANTSNTLQDFINYNQNFASQEYGNVWNRSKSAYDTNYQTQYADPFKFKLQSAEDAFAPQMVGYSTNAANIQHQNDVANSNSWQKFLSSYDIFKDQRDSTFNKRFAVAGA